MPSSWPVCWKGNHFIIMPIRKILIANRGEIACRIIRTARKMGIATVAVYSPADRNALFVQMADEKVALQGNPATQSYLDAAQIIAACQATQADAVHPGYGFLSENAAFARSLRDAGITFIGPSPEAIEALGDKISAKALATREQVATVPGYREALKDAEEAGAKAAEIGFPIILKAAAGGGGKGMRIARSVEEAKEGFTLCRSEALSSFKDDRVFLERYIDNPRHIEVQILADQHGGVVALYERECTLQRRHQKVIEEAPSPFINTTTRQAMYAQAIQLAKAAGYSSAGTVEFVVGQDQSFYFLEMNTRLQVEHPVTEEITGLDLVEWMIRIANGEKLPWTMDTLPALKGHSIEVRLYAEDPTRGFMPSIGRITRYQPPMPSEHIRIESGLREGDEISTFYDPMIAKVIATAPTRAEATAKLVDALDAFVVDGVRHNLSFLNNLLLHPDFARFNFSTNFIGLQFGDTPQPTAPNQATLRQLIAISASCAHRKAALIGQPPHRLACRYNGQHIEIELGNSDSITVDGEAFAISSAWQPHQALWHGTVNGQTITVQAKPLSSHSWLLLHHGHELTLALLPPHILALAEKMPEKPKPDLSNFLLSPMPGLLLDIMVAEGDEVKAGQTLAIVEAMKMENVLRAQRDGVVAKIHAQKGASLSVDQVILEFKA